ncbi:MAG: diguanylate cyclase [Myxococcales bacterium]|nr:diguanylate cyclase [Myxococcales bacterium]
MQQWQITPYFWLYFGALLLCFYVSLEAWRFPSGYGRNWFRWMIASIDLWLLSYILGFFHKDPQWKSIILRAEYLGIIGAATFWCLFSLSYTHTGGRWLTPKKTAMIFIIPVVSYLLVLSYPLHTLFYKKVEFVQEDGLVLLKKHYSFGFYIWTSYAYVMLSVGLLALISSFSKMSRSFRWQFMPLIFAISLIVSSNLSYILGSNPLAPYDITSLSFAVVSGIILYVMKRFRFLDLIPVAHEHIFHSIQSGVIILDAQERIIEINPAALELTSLPHDKLLGQSIHTAFPDQACFIEPHLQKQHHKFELNFHDRIFEAQITPLQHASNNPLGKLITLYDITLLKTALAEIQRIARIDPLTQVANRLAMQERLDTEAERSRRYDGTFSVVIGDIDKFKMINDTYGHQCGDYVLSTLAQLLQETARKSDLVARWGGEEFCILLPQTSVTQAKIMLERIRSRLAKHVFTWNQQTIRVTATFGVAEHKKELPIEHTIQKADQALYQGKHDGRNRISLHISSTGIPLPDFSEISDKETGTEIQSLSYQNHLRSLK